MNEQNKITKEQYISLLDGNIKKIDYDAIISKIGNRFCDILKRICTKFEWFDYDNGYVESVYGNRTEAQDGYFNPKKYSVKDLIRFTGEYNLPMPYGDGDGIPVRWLWEDFEKEFEEEVEQYKINAQKQKEEERKKRIEHKAKKLEMMQIIKSKLTKEELKFIKFK